MSDSAGSASDTRPAADDGPRDAPAHGELRRDAEGTTTELVGPQDVELQGPEQPATPNRPRAPSSPAASPGVAGNAAKAPATVAVDDHNERRHSATEGRAGAVDAMALVETELGPDAVDVPPGPTQLTRSSISAEEQQAEGDVPAWRPHKRAQTVVATMSLSDLLASPGFGHRRASSDGAGRPHAASMPAEPVFRTHREPGETKEQPKDSFLVKIGSAVAQDDEQEVAKPWTAERYEQARRASILAVNQRPRPHIKLETLSSGSTKMVLMLTYLAVIAAIVITTLSKLGVDSRTVLLDAVSCSAQDPTAANYGCVEGFQNGSVWHGYVSGLDRLEGDIGLAVTIVNSTAILPYMSSVSGSLYRATVPFLAQLSSRVDGVGLESLLNKTGTVRIDCASNVCSTESLFDAVDTAQVLGVGTGFTSYQIDVTLSSVPDEVATPALQFKFTYQATVYSLLSTSARAALQLVTVIIGFIWFIALYKESRKGRRILRQQHWVTLLLIALLLWQNTPLVVVHLVPGAGAGWALAAEIFQTVALSMLLLFWLLMMDGLKFNQNESLSLWFYVPKVLYSLIFIVITLCLQFVKRISWFNHSITLSAVDYDPKLSTALGVLCVLFLIHILVWFCWFCIDIVSTLRVLAPLPYMDTRFQQLAFRFLLFQQVVVILFVIVLYAFLGVDFLVNLVNGTTTTSTLSVVRLVNILIGGFQPFGELLLISMFAYLTIIINMPADAGHVEIPSFLLRFGEKYLPVLKHHHAPQFNLETCCWLFDFAWQAYYDPPGVHTISSYGNFNVTPHGFVMDAFMSDIASDTHCIIVRRGPRVVVAFRGTSSARNAQTDMQFRRGQVIFRGQHHRIDRKIFGANVGALRSLLPRIHKGFWSAYCTMREAVASTVTASLIAAGPQCRLYVTGHSLGGALATLAAYDLSPLVRRIKQVLLTVQRPLPPSDDDVHHRRTASMTRAQSWAGSPRPVPAPRPMPMFRSSSQRHSLVAAGIMSPAPTFPPLRRVSTPESSMRTPASHSASGTGILPHSRPSRTHSHVDLMQAEIRGLVDDIAVATLERLTQDGEVTGLGAPTASASDVVAQVVAGFNTDATSERILEDKAAGGKEPDEEWVPTIGRVANLSSPPTSNSEAKSSAGEAKPFPITQVSTPEGLTPPEDHHGLPAEMQFRMADQQVVVRSLTDNGVRLVVNEQEAPATEAAPRRETLDWLGERGLLDEAEEHDQGTGIVPFDMDEQDDVVMYNYGSPRVGNYGFAILYGLEVPCSFRVVHDGDVVTAVPKMIRLYKHVGHEVEIDAHGNSIVDPSYIERQFRTPYKLHVSSHSMYAYRDSLRNCRMRVGLPLPGSYAPSVDLG